VHTVKSNPYTPAGGVYGGGGATIKEKYIKESNDFFSLSEKVAA